MTVIRREFLQKCGIKYSKLPRDDEISLGRRINPKCSALLSIDHPIRIETANKLPHHQCYNIFFGNETVKPPLGSYTFITTITAPRPKTSVSSAVLLNFSQYSQSWDNER